jgi:hypothetical protein
MKDDKMMKNDKAMEKKLVAVRRRASLFLVALLAAAGFVAGPVAGQALRVGAAAPDVAGERWINSEPLTTPNLRGRVVLVEFWTFG